jgi:hypothetical protein
MTKERQKTTTKLKPHRRENKYHAQVAWQRQRHKNKNVQSIHKYKLSP